MKQPEVLCNILGIIHAHRDHMSLLDFVINIPSNRDDHLAKLSDIYPEGR